MESIDIENDGRRKITVRSKTSGAGYSCYENKLYDPFLTAVKKAQRKKRNISQ